MAPASQEPESASPTTTRPDNESSVDNVAQAYRDLLRGEQAATALEANLTNLENRLDALLAAFEAADEPQKEHNVPTATQDDDPKDGAATHNGDSNGQKEGSSSAGAAKKP